MLRAAAEARALLEQAAGRINGRFGTGFSSLSCLSRLPGVSAMHSSFVIRAIKDWAGYHLR